MNPRISIVIPTYNRAATVGKTIDSALAQTVPDIEVIVVDDGSSDDTRKVLNATYGDRIRYFFQENQGASCSRNRGIKEAQGEWIAFLDSDDVWETDKLEWQLRAMTQFGSRCGGCYTDVRFMNHPETRTFFQMAENSYRHDEIMGINPSVLELLVKPGGAGMLICLSSLLARADLLRKTGGFDPTLLYSQDSELMFRLGMLTEFCYVNRPLVWFDRSPAELRHVGVCADWNKVDFKLQDSQARLEGQLRLSSGLPEKIRKVIREQLRSVHSGWANWYLETGQNGKAREAAWKAVQTDLNFNVALKWLLTWMSPKLALRAVQNHQEMHKDSSSIV